MRGCSLISLVTQHLRLISPVIFILIAGIQPEDSLLLHLAHGDTPDPPVIRVCILLLREQIQGNDLPDILDIHQEPVRMVHPEHLGFVADDATGYLTFILFHVLVHRPYHIKALQCLSLAVAQHNSELPPQGAVILARIPRILLLVVGVDSDLQLNDVGGVINGLGLGHLCRTSALLTAHAALLLLFCVTDADPAHILCHPAEVCPGLSDLRDIYGFDSQLIKLLAV